MCYRTIVQTVRLFHYFTKISVEGFKYFSKNLWCVKKSTCLRNNEHLESRLLQPAVGVTMGGQRDDNVLLMIKESQRPTWTLS